MKVECVKDLIMDTGVVAFLAGNIYTMNKLGTMFVSTNEQGLNHYFDGYGQDDWANWFEEVKN